MLYSIITFKWRSPDMRIGKVVRYIRLSKHLKIKNVYTGILERPAVTKFEKGISDTTAEKFMKILNNLNMTYDQFRNLHTTQNEMENNDLHSQYAVIISTKDMTNLKEFESKTKEIYQQTYQINSLHYSVLTKLAILSLSDEQLDKKNLDLLQDYLFECREWSYYELMLFMHSMPFFSVDNVLLLYNSLKANVQQEPYIRKYNPEVFSLILSILKLFIKLNDTAHCKEIYSDLIKNVSEVSNTMYEKIMVLFYGELMKLSEKKIMDSEIINQSITAFDFLSMPEEKKECLELVDIVKRNNGLL